MRECGRIPYSCIILDCSPSLLLAAVLNSKFEEADKLRELQEFLAMHVERAKEATITSSEDTVYTWDLT